MGHTHPLVCLLLIRFILLELRIMGGSEILMASQHGNKHGTLAIEPVSTRQGDMVEINVADLDPDPPDPHVFGPPGSGCGFVSQRYGSGSGSDSSISTVCDFFLTFYR
jgi:hypothetical protein